MLFKISLSNIRKSIKDYAVYFFTLIIGVAVFYVFNAIETQTAFLQISEDQRDIIKVLIRAISAVSVFVAIVLGLLIVYASRFLMKRRNREFALYMMLGMSKWKISALLLCETVIIGISSLFVGIVIGIGLSQVMSAVVANLFNADMNDYRFTVSASSIIKTILYFSIMYVIVMLRSGVVISRCRLITLIQSGRRSEKNSMKNPWLCVAVFIVSAAALGYAYYLVGWNQMDITEKKVGIAIVIGVVSTFLIFWSAAGMLLRLIMSVKGLYHRGLNSFTFRQISSKINTTVASMTVICLMLFLTICTLASAFTMRTSMKKRLESDYPVNCGIIFSYMDEDEEGDEVKYIYGNIDDIYALSGENVYDDLDDAYHFHYYNDEDFTYNKAIGETDDKELHEIGMQVMNFHVKILKLSDYNALMKIYKGEQIKLTENEYAIASTFSLTTQLFNNALANNNEINIFGTSLLPKFNKCIDTIIFPGQENEGVAIVPDSVITDESNATVDMIVGNYRFSDKDSEIEAEKQFCDKWEKVVNSPRVSEIAPHNNGYYHVISTRLEAANATVGISALVTFLGLYIGFIFLVSCGAILALKELSESADSIPRYTMLRKLGVEESDITKSLFRQSAIFFLLPLILAGLHSYFGMKLGTFMLSMIVESSLLKPILLTSGVIVLIYGGYFLLTFLCSRAIIKEQK